MVIFVSRNINPLESGVVGITRMNGGDAYNIVLDSVTLSGTCQTFSPDVQNQIEFRMVTQVNSICEAFGAKGKLDYRRQYPSTVNTRENADICARVVEILVGRDTVKRDPASSMGKEDFAFMLQQPPGAGCKLLADSRSDSLTNKRGAVFRVEYS